MTIDTNFLNDIFVFIEKWKVPVEIELFLFHYFQIGVSFNIYKYIQKVSCKLRTLRLYLVQHNVYHKWCIKCILRLILKIAYMLSSAFKRNFLDLILPPTLYNNVVTPWGIVINLQETVWKDCDYDKYIWCVHLLFISTDK